MTWFDFVVLTFAASAIVDVWRNGSLFADWRGFFESDDDRCPDPVLTPGEPGIVTNKDAIANMDLHAGVEVSRLPRLMQLADRWVPRFVGEILTCSFCFSHHTPWIVGVVCFFPAMFAPAWLAFLLKLPAYSLAATRIGNLINAWAPPSSKYDQ
jgi:hypothetical protein